LKKFIAEIESGGLSVIGPVREDNQDSIRLQQNNESSLFAIADGMGGYAHGGVASLLALDSFFNTLAEYKGNSVLKILQRGIDTANLKVYQKAQQLDAGRMGTTLTAAYISGDMLYLVHVGDSRAYLIRNGQAVCLTSDHTTVGDMVRAKLISPNKVRTHAQRSILTKAIGISLFIQPDILQKRLMEGDTLVLCSDGLWSALEDQQFAQVTKEAGSVDEISQRLINLALQNGADDNASVIVFYLNKLIQISSEDENKNTSASNWFKNLMKFMSWMAML
jgi:protein phosphatase